MVSMGAGKARQGRSKLYVCDPGFTVYTPFALTKMFQGGSKIHEVDPEFQTFYAISEKKPELSDLFSYPSGEGSNVGQK